MVMVGSKTQFGNIDIVEGEFGKFYVAYCRLEDVDVWEHVPLELEGLRQFDVVVGSKERLKPNMHLITPHVDNRVLISEIVMIRKEDKGKFDFGLFVDDASRNSYPMYKLFTYACKRGLLICDTWSAEFGAN